MSLARPSRTGPHVGPHVGARLAIRAGAVAATAALLLSVAGPALAARTTRSDPADATGSLSDVRGVTVNHGPEIVLTKVRFTDLRQRSDAARSVFFDTDRTRKGPEFRLATGLQAVTEYELHRTRGWKAVGGVLNCSYGVRFDFAAEVATVRIARSCLGEPARVRVAVRMTDYHDGSHPIRDWVGNPGSFTSPVAAG